MTGRSLGKEPDGVIRFQVSVYSFERATRDSIPNLGALFWAVVFWVVVFWAVVVLGSGAVPELLFWS